MNPLKLQEYFIYKPGAPQLPNYIDRIEIYAKGIDWIKIAVLKATDFSSASNLYDVIMQYKSPVNDAWVILEPLGRWEYRLPLGKGLEALVESGKAAFSDSEALYQIGLNIEDEIKQFERRAKIREARMKEFAEVVAPAFIPEEKKNELQLKANQLRAQQMDMDAKLAALETDFQQIKSLMGDISPMKAAEIRQSLKTKYFGPLAPKVEIPEPEQEIKTLADTPMTPNIGEISIDIGTTT